MQMKNLAAMTVALAVLTPELVNAQFGVPIPRRAQPPETQARPVPPGPTARDRLDARVERLVRHTPCSPETLPALDDSMWAAAAFYDAAISDLRAWRDAAARRRAEWQELVDQARARLERYKSNPADSDHLPALPPGPAFAEARRFHSAAEAAQQQRKDFIDQTIDLVVESIEHGEAGRAYFRAAVRRGDAALDALRAEANLQEQFYTTVRYQIRVDCLRELEPPTPSRGPTLWPRFRRR